jgi:HlyD family secretion protein
MLRSSPASDSDPAVRARRSLRAHGRTGLALLLCSALGLGGWASTATLSGAVIAPATVVIDGKAKVVQHRDGGAISEIFVREGDHVTAGSLLLKLSDVSIRSELGILTSQLHTQLARQARLLAERSGAPMLGPITAVDVAPTDPQFQAAIAGEAAHMKARAHSRAIQAEQLSERVQQIQHELAGRESQLEARRREIAIVRVELADLTHLREMRLVTTQRYNTVERSLVGLEGEEGNLRASIARLRNQILETAAQISAIDMELQTEVARDLRDADDKLGEVRERRIAVQDKLRHVDLIAPVTGIVHQLEATTGGVFAPNGTVMQIVPDGERLVLEARVQRWEIDRVVVDQPARLRFTAFDSRTTPEIMGHVVDVSPDAEADKRTGVATYAVKIMVKKAELARLGSISLKAGMPAEAFLITGDQTALSYLLKPLSDQLARAFTER